MSKLKPWAAGPFELIRHAEGHLKAGSDFDKRMALISYDNAIEVSITTFLQLHPSQRGGKTYERKKTEEWLTSYHKKLEFLEHFAKEKGVSLQVSIDEIIYYHNLRNELYHSGNGLVPECRHLDEARTAALLVFSCLFGVDAEPLLKIGEINVQAKARPAVSEQSAFLEVFIDLEKTLKSVLHGMGLVDHNFARISMRPAWRLFIQNAGRVTNRFSGIVERAIRVRNAIVHGQPTGLKEGYLPGLTKGIARIAEFVGKYPISVDILPELKKRYPNWIREDLSTVRVIQKSGRVFLETTVCKTGGAVRDEKVERMDLCFIGDGVPEEMNDMFSPEDTAFDNAQKFLSEMDPFSLSMVTNLFREEVHDVIAAEFGPSRKKE